MPEPVTYLEINSPDAAASRTFLAAAFGWEWQPFAAPDYFVAPGGDSPGIDTGLLPSRDGVARAVPVLRVPSLAEATARVRRHGGSVVVEPFVVAGVGRGCYVVDPAGVLLGLHEYDPDAR
jgi:predicted enzyme related to lactoylglutathione lyase